MIDSISFPNLGIEKEHVGRAFSILGFDIAYYGILIGIGILAGVTIIILEARRTRQHSEDYMDLAIWTVIFGIIGARIYYVIFEWDIYKDNLLSIFNIRQGGMGIYGGIIAAVIVVFVYAGIRKLYAPELLDTACMGLTAGQMIGRWGNYYNREAFGEYTDGLFAMRLPIDAVRISDVTDRMRNHIETIDGSSYIQVHPTFLYESIWCFLLLIVLFLYRYQQKFEGELFLVYLCGYGIGRVWIEGLRTDQLLIGESGWPVSQVLAGVLVLISLLLIIYNRNQDDRTRLRRMREKEAKRKARSRNMFHER